MQKVYYRDWQASRQVPLAFVVSRAAAPLTRLLASRRVDPNRITIVAALCGAVAVACVALGAWVLAAVGLVAFLVLDHVDGQVARATNRRTALGGYLDSLADLLVDVLFLAAIVAWGIIHDSRLALLGLFALVAYTGLELVGRHGAWTLVLQALRARDFTPNEKTPTISSGNQFMPIAAHRDLNILVLAVGLFSGFLAWSLAVLTIWWTAWALQHIYYGVQQPKKTIGVLAQLVHEDNH